MSQRLPSQDSFDEEQKPELSPKKTSNSVIPIKDGIIQKLPQTIKRLRDCQNCLSQVCYSDIKYLWDLSRYTPDTDMRSKIITGFGEENFVNVFLRIWSSTKDEDIFNQQFLYPWKNLRNSLSIVWNCCDSSNMVCEQITKSGLLPQLLEGLKEVSSQKGYLLHERKLYYTKALFGILHNCTRNYSESHKVLVRAHGINILQTFTLCSHPMIKAKSLIILSYLVDEEHHEVISASMETLKFIVGILHETLKVAEHFSPKYGMNSIEVMKGLNNIAHNDTNKVKLVQCGVIICYKCLLRSDSNEEKTLAATGIWTLSFAKENKTDLREDEDCIKVLRDIAKGDEISVSHAARGALWEIFHDQQISPDSDLEANTPHVMISYQWAAQDVMVKVKDRLRHAGYKVWMDVEHMSGSTLEAMALAVEKSTVVLICMSDKYKLSPSCRTESEYIFRLRKDIIPLRLQSQYIPDGWLGMMVGTKLYFDFSDEEQIDEQMPKLLRELGNRGKIRSTCIPEIVEPQMIQQSMYMTSSSGSSVPSDSLSQSVMCWTKLEVSDWLSATGFDHVKDRFSEFDGSLLVELKRLQKLCPEFFYSNMKTELKLSFCDILKFSRALSQL